jgi:O-antigen/teichoic acid export membrane protein
LGQFALAFQVIYLPWALLANAVDSTYYQRAAERWAQGRHLADLWAMTAKKLLLMGLPIYGAAFLLSPSLFPWVFGPAWGQAGQYAALLAPGAFFAFITSPLGRTCLIVGTAWYLPLWHAARTAGVALVAYLAWRGSWSPDGFITSLVIQQILLFLIDYGAEWRFAGYKPNLEVNGPNVGKY